MTSSFTPKRQFPHHPFLSQSEVASLIGFSRQRLFQLVDKGEFPEPVGDSRLYKNRMRYWDTSEIYEWCEIRFYELIGQYKKTIKYYETRKCRYRKTHPKVAHYFGFYDFLTSEPFSNHHWVGQITWNAKGKDCKKMDLDDFPYLNFKQKVVGVERDALIRYCNLLVKVLNNDEMRVGDGNSDCFQECTEVIQELKTSYGM